MHLTVGGAIGQLGRADFAAAERRERAILRLYSTPQRYCVLGWVGWVGSEGGSAAVGGGRQRPGRGAALRQAPFTSETT